MNLFTSLIFLDPVYGMDDGIIPPPPPAPPAIRNMVTPDVDTMYTDRVRLVRVRRTTSGGYQQRHYDGEPGPEEAANVRSRTVTRDDPKAGRVIVQTVWHVRTPVNRQVEADDMWLYVDLSGDERRLVAEGPSVPKGEGGISYLTECTERA